jgi:sorting nexin-29
MPSQWTVPSADEVEEIPIPTLEEVNCAVLKLENDRASGPDGLNAELLKVDKIYLVNRLWKLIEKIWKEEMFPSQWEEGLICPIYKKGDRMMCENYRGVSLLNTACKVFSVILFQRLQPIVETSIGNSQCGFRPGKSISDHLHSDNYWKRSKNMELTCTICL